MAIPHIYPSTFLSDGFKPPFKPPFCQINRHYLAVYTKTGPYPSDLPTHDSLCIGCRLHSVMFRGTFVMYCSGFSSICVGLSWGVHIFILLNLWSLKGSLFFPTLFWVKRTGPGSSILIAIKIARKTGERTTSPPKERIISNPRY